MGQNFTHSYTIAGGKIDNHMYHCTDYYYYSVIAIAFQLEREKRNESCADPDISRIIANRALFLPTFILSYNLTRDNIAVASIPCN